MPEKHNSLDSIISCSSSMYATDAREARNEKRTAFTSKQTLRIPKPHTVTPSRTIKRKSVTNVQSKLVLHLWYYLVEEGPSTSARKVLGTNMSHKKIRSNHQRSQASKRFGMYIALTPRHHTHDRAQGGGGDTVCCPAPPTSNTRDLFSASKCFFATDRYYSTVGIKHA